jgi:Na+/H+ antiporter NhaD/arsenite permease-like protein
MIRAIRIILYIQRAGSFFRVALLCPSGSFHRLLLLCEFLFVIYSSFLPFSINCLVQVVIINRVHREYAKCVGLFCVMTSFSSWCALLLLLEHDDAGRRERERVRERGRRARRKHLTIFS